MSYQYNDDDPLVTLSAIVLGAVTFIAVMLSCIGCATTQCPECVPEIKTVEVKVPVYSCPVPEAEPPFVLPPWPEFPSTTEEQAMKDWYAALVSTQKVREKVLKSRIEYLRGVLGAYR